MIHSIFHTLTTGFHDDKRNEIPFERTNSMAKTRELLLCTRKINEIKIIVSVYENVSELFQIRLEFQLKN